jgi:5-methylcytosine-specific restriction endonuclease McrA
MSAPRIDTFRSTIDGLIIALSQIRDETQDLHELAYSRYRAAQESKVRGGSPDYALDNHGDKRARELYTEVARATVGLGRDVLGSLDRIRSYLTAGDGSVYQRRNKAGDAPRAEVLSAIAAAERRRKRGEYAPTRIAAIPQIDAIEAAASAQGELLHLANAVRKMCSGLKADRRLLTPIEQEAWRNALKSKPEGHRRHISIAVRHAVMQRDGHRCVECQATTSLALDHIIPYSAGGEDTVENLRVLCKSCNSRKGARPLEVQTENGEDQKAS